MISFGACAFISSDIRQIRPCRRRECIHQASGACGKLLPLCHSCRNPLAPFGCPGNACASPPPARRRHPLRPLRAPPRAYSAKPAVISALASGLLYLSNPTLAARVSTCGHRSLRIACGGGRQGLLIATRLQALLQPSVDRRLERQVAGQSSRPCRHDRRNPEQPRGIGCRDAGELGNRPQRHP